MNVRLSDYYADLNISIYKEDVLLLLKQGYLKEDSKEGKKIFVELILEEKLNRDRIVKEKAISQLKFQFDSPDYYIEDYSNNPDMLSILGYEITLKKSTFEDYVQKEDNEARVEPFWCRGMQFNCHFDRMHLTYHKF